jgi:hypothetical protein
VICKAERYGEVAGISGCSCRRSAARVWDPMASPDPQPQPHSLLDQTPFVGPSLAAFFDHCAITGHAFERLQQHPGVHTPRLTR